MVSTGPAAQADLSVQVSAADRALVAPPLQEPLTRERFYFVMTDRFANGNTANDRAGLPGGPRDHGFDPTLYHNRGDTSFVGENSEYGDFFGLDDLFTEHPRVVRGMTEIF